MASDYTLPLPAATGTARNRETLSSDGQRPDPETARWDRANSQDVTNGNFYFLGFFYYYYFKSNLGLKFKLKHQITIIGIFTVSIVLPFPGCHS